ncbi:hypothetical protein FSOLCH5_014613 [Fusarium solani]
MKPLSLLTSFLGTIHAASSKVVKTQDGVRLTYTQSGPVHGQQILFIPGWRQTAAEWKKQVKYFSSAGYRVTAYDMRGHGESEKPDFGYRISRFAADLNDLLKQLDLKDVSIVAHSMGSSISWAWWDQYPEAHDRISRFVFVDQSSVLTADPHWNEAQAKQVSALFDPIGVYDLANNMTDATPPFVRSMFTDSTSKADFEWVLAQNRKISDKNAATLVIDHAFRDWRDVLPRIDVPSLVIAGEVSVNAAPGIAWVATQIPGGQAYTFTKAEKGSHFMFWENPSRFNSIVENFITS